MADVVVFRRIGGRVVPIHMKRESQAARIAKGAAALAAGATIAKQGGKYAYGLLRKSADYENRARAVINQTKGQFGQMSLFSAKRVASGEKILQLSERVFKSRNLALLAADTAAGALIGYGVGKLTESKTKDKKAFTTAAVGAGFGSIFYRLHIDPTAGIRKAVNYAANRHHAQTLFKEL